MRTVLPNGLPRLLTAARWSRYFPSMRGMSGRRRSLTSGVGLCVGVAALAGCAQPAEPPSGTGPVTYRYTCCESADLDPMLLPGDVLVLRWIVETVPPTRTYPETAVTLSASLSGSFTDAAQLKGSVGAVVPSHEVAAAPLQTTTRAGGGPSELAGRAPGPACEESSKEAQLATVNLARRCFGCSISSAIATAKSSALMCSPAGESSAVL